MTAPMVPPNLRPTAVVWPGSRSTVDERVVRAPLTTAVALTVATLHKKAVLRTVTVIDVLLVLVPKTTTVDAASTGDANVRTVASVTAASPTLFILFPMAIALPPERRPFH